MKGQTMSKKGYVFLRMPDHPRASNGYVQEHIVVVEKAIGRPLPPLAVVHHVNETRSDNANRNLVACQDDGYHKLLHVRLRVLRAGGDPNTMQICFKCRKPQLHAEFSGGTGRGGRSPWCRACVSAYDKRRYERRRGGVL